MKIGESKKTRMNASEERKETIHQKAKEIMEAREEQWKAFRSQAVKWINDNASLEEKARMVMDHDYRENWIISRAENIALENFCAPPGWTSYIDCEACGIHPAPPVYEKGTKVKFCPWCHVMRDMHEDLKHPYSKLEKLEAENEARYLRVKQREAEGKPPLRELTQEEAFYADIDDDVTPLSEYPKGKPKVQEVSSKSEEPIVKEADTSIDIW
jgi:hypothetical protein